MATVGVGEGTSEDKGGEHRHATDADARDCANGRVHRVRVGAELDHPYGKSRPQTDTRAVSTTLGYALTLSITTLLITGLILAGGTYVEDQREQVIRSELQVIGEQVSSDLAAVDRLSQTSQTDRVVIARQVPDEIAGTTYTIEVVDAGTTNAHLELTTATPDVTVNVDLELTTTIAPGSVGGGDVEIVYDGTDLEVRDV